MYFQIDNTPENIRRLRNRRSNVAEKETVECPKLILAPFSRPPQLLFEDVDIGSTCETYLDIQNPSKKTQQITIEQNPLPGMTVHLPESCLILEPESIYTVKFSWIPFQHMSSREVIHVRDDMGRKYDIVIILKTKKVNKNIEKKKTIKKSPGKIIKKHVTKTSPKQHFSRVNKVSPTAINKKKMNVLYYTTKENEAFNIVTKHQPDRLWKASDKENIIPNYDDCFEMKSDKCPFDSPSSFLDITGLFPLTKKSKIEENTKMPLDNYNASSVNYKQFKAGPPENNLVTCSTKISEVTDTDIFDNLSFTPLKNVGATQLRKGPKIITSIDSERDFNYSLESAKIKVMNETHSIISVSSVKYPENKLDIPQIKIENLITNVDDTTKFINKRIPNTSSPKEFSSPNFTINQSEFSRISDLSFAPQRYSTERKVKNFLDLLDDQATGKVSSETYPKLSSLESDCYLSIDQNLPYQFNRGLTNNTNKGRQLQYDNLHSINQRDKWESNFPSANYFEFNLRNNNISPRPTSPRSPPPLQSIPEESTQFSETRTIDTSERQTATFTINRTYDNGNHKKENSMKQLWQKKSVNCEPDIWKVPHGYVIKTNELKREGKNCCVNTSLLREKEANVSSYNSLLYTCDVYTQSSTVDPFSSTTYFYDEVAVHKFEQEFKRWLNCILTPPADLDSNIEEKVDIGKAWFENRNKEVPAAPTKEQVCNQYHNSHRLVSLRKSARTLFMGSEIIQVFQKLSKQIDKKLIAIRNDRNLHLDVGLQKIIMELLLCYNPLWLRIGLEAIYGTVIPLKSNNDIEGLTTFILQRLFKNPFLKNKNSKSSAPNKLLPAYLDAIKKFTLKKFFMLVYFLDQAKQKKLILHDPCLFCRNAPYKESRELLIRFTREVIAGIGDITKHLRPMGYVVSHKQCYIDEYKYAVHNLATDIKDGVRLTKVMEIILVRTGLLSQLRTPAISRLQKIHNVQVALTALKDANFVITGDITAKDIADGHREKTLSLLWQIIHVFKAPLFEKSANVIQVWWRNKLQIILKIRKEIEALERKRCDAAAVIQHWWRQIQYKRYTERKMIEFTKATITIQKYCRRWICQKRFYNMKKSVKIIEHWYRSIICMRQSKLILERLQTEKKSAIKIQQWYRKMRCVQKILIVCDLYIEYCADRKKQIWSATTISRYYTRYCIINKWRNLVNDVVIIDKEEKLKQKSALVIQSNIRMWICQRKYSLIRRKIILIQCFVRRILVQKRLQILKKTVLFIQKKYKGKKLMQKEMGIFAEKRNSVVKIQNWYRNIIKAHRILNIHNVYLKYCSERKHIITSVKIIKYYLRRNKNINKFRNVVKLVFDINTERKLKEKSSTIIQSYIRRWICVQKFNKTRQKVILLQSVIKGFLVRNYIKKLKYHVLIIQKRYRNKKQMQLKMTEYQTMKKSAIVIQQWYRKSLEKDKILKIKYIYEQYCFKRKTEISAAHTIKNCLKRNILINKLRAVVNSVIQLQKQHSSAVILQSYIRRWLCIRQYRSIYKNVVTIQKMIRGYLTRKRYTKLKKYTTFIQQKFRSKRIMRSDIYNFIKQKKSAIIIQSYYKMSVQFKYFHKLKQAVRTIEEKRIGIIQARKDLAQTIYIRNIIKIQSWYRMRKARINYIKTKNAIICIQNNYHSYKLKRSDREKYLKMYASVNMIQSVVRMYIQKKKYIKTIAAIKTIQKSYKLWKNKMLMKIQQQRRYEAAICIQKYMKMFFQKSRYLNYKKHVIFVQKIWKGKLYTRLIRWEFLQKINMIIKLQAVLRGYLVRKHLPVKRATLMKEQEEKKLHWAASKIQALFRGNMVRKQLSNQKRIVELRKRWRLGALHSTQQSLEERNEEALGVFVNINTESVTSIIKAFQSLEFLTEVYPKLYDNNAATVVHKLFHYVVACNRSVPSIEILKIAAAILVNLARYKASARQIYNIQQISFILKLMLRFSSSDPELFCKFCTYVWLFSKYNGIQEDLTNFLRLKKNKKMLDNIKSSITRHKKMKGNIKNKPSTSRTTNMSSSMESSFIMPILEPDYGIERVDCPRYFQDPQQAINALYSVYNL